MNAHPQGDLCSLAITVVPYRPPEEPTSRLFSGIARCSCDLWEQQIAGMDMPSAYMRALTREWECHVLDVARRMPNQDNDN